MAAAPEKVRVRSYNVGFGDCFLLTFFYAKDDSRSVLIDFGSTKKADDGPKGGMLEIAERIREDCGGKLHTLVATHRHTDHISGFAGKPGEVIASLEPELVVQPWTEEPGLDPKAPAPADGDGKALRAAATARLSAMQAVAAAALEQVPRLRKACGMSKEMVEEIRFLGETNIANAESVDNLAAMGKRKRCAYVSFGDKLPLSKLLPGVRADVLGPPTLRQAPKIMHEAQTDKEEFWHLAARRFDGAEGDVGAPLDIFGDAPTAQPSAHQEARWVIPHVDQMRGDELLAIVRSLDGALNNTSVILLFEVGDIRLLFPGDAQLENWSYALFESDRADEIKERLADVRLYKVGHHGSLNATPKTLWNGFDRRNEKASSRRLETMVSTATGKHGTVERGTEVPRKVLIEELERKSDLYNTQSLKDPKAFWNDAELDLQSA